MKKFVDTYISETVEYGFSFDDIMHLQSSYSELIDSIVKRLVDYNSGDVFILYGAEVAENSGEYTMTSGAAYYNGEVYLIDAITTPIVPGEDSLVWRKVTSYHPGDPVKYSNGASYNTRQINKIALEIGALGSGLENYGSSKVTRGRIRKEIPIGGWNMDDSDVVIIPHGFDNPNQIIKGIRAIIFADTNNSAKSIEASGSVGFDQQYIILTRDQGGHFDSTLYDATSFNRGFVTIEFLG